MFCYCCRVASAELLLHPVRLRIVKAFMGDRPLTTAQLIAELDDLPPGSVYRHVALLARAGVLQVVAERRVRAAVERTYMLRPRAAQIGAAEAAAMTVDEHTAAFTAYVAGMLADFDRYLASGTPDPTRDGADYRVAALWLSDAELVDLLRDLQAVFQPRLANAPNRARRRRLLYSVLLPAVDRSRPPATGQRREPQPRLRSRKDT